MSSRNVLVVEKDGTIEIDDTQLQILRQIVHTGMARHGRVLGTPEGEESDPPTRRGPP